MRRTHNRGGQSWQSSSRVSGGPLMTDHHLGLQDIDKELELLQRKREIIEQQQKMLSDGFQGRNEYEESYGPSSGYNNYRPSFTDRRDYNPPSRKRPIAVWDDDVPSKRFSGATRTRSRFRPIPSHHMRSGPVYSSDYQDSLPHQPVRPLSGPFKPKPPKKDANPPKPAKSTEGPKPKPSAERKKVPEAPNLKEGERDLNICLCPDREPTKQVVGRLELALGCIIKEIKANLEPNMVLSVSVLRDIKTTIRERIREIMMGRVVGPAEDIISRYREVHNKQTDNDLVVSAIEAQTGEIPLYKIDDPEKYFKINMHRIMQFKLKRLLVKIEEASRAEVNAKSGKASGSTDTSGKIPDENPDEQIILDEAMVNTDKYQRLEKWLTLKMPVLIKQFLPHIIKIMDIDSKYHRLKSMITSETVKMLAEKGGFVLDDDVSMTDVSAPPGTPAKTPRAPSRALPYYAKLMGKPGLPKRNQMQQFFEEFQPKSIKKHRTVHNLLFVGFDQKENLDKIIAANGTVIGKYTLSIRISERNKVEQVKHNESSDKLIGSELDDQITDLLLSIRKEEEAENEVKTEANANFDANFAEDAVIQAETAEIKTAVVNETDAVVNETDAVVNETDAVINETDAVINETDAVVNETDAVINETDAVMNETDAVVNKTDAVINETDAVVNEIDADANLAKKSDDLAIIENTDQNVTVIDDTTKSDDSNCAENNTNNSEGTSDKQTEPAGNGIEQVEEKSNGIESEKADQVKPLVNDKAGRATPTRASSRLAATPGRIQTRRASRLAQNDA